MDRCDVVIIGAGFAGAATARALVAGGCPDVVVVESERTPGEHASGRNAGMVRRAVEDPALLELADEGAREIQRLAGGNFPEDNRRDVPTEGLRPAESGPVGELPTVHFRATGSLLLGARGRLPDRFWRDEAHRAPDARSVRACVPLLAGAAFGDALETPGDGVVEVHSLLARYLAEARVGGARILLGCRALGPLRDGAAVRGVVTDRGRICARHVVIAAGAWAESFGRECGAAARLTPRRRHIVCTALPAGAAAERASSWPWVWDLERKVYFRPESCGLLWSPCDELDDRPGAPPADPEANRWLAEKVAGWLPEAGDLRPVRMWAGQRTFAPDGRFLLGPDPRRPGLHWAAGLGGHGVTVSAAIGRRVAAGILEGESGTPAHAVRGAILSDEVKSESRSARAVDHAASGR